VAASRAWFCIARSTESSPGEAAGQKPYSVQYCIDNSLRTTRRSQGIYGADDRFQLSLRALTSITAYEKQIPGKKMLIWISPGWPMLSGPGVQLSSKDQQALFNTIVAAATTLLQARITLYSIDPLGLADAGGLRTTLYQQFLKGVRAPKQVQAGNLALQVLHQPVSQGLSTLTPSPG
jgi:hypothetical protein